MSLFKLLFICFFVTTCGENLIEEVVERYDDGKFKVVHYYKPVGDNQQLSKLIHYYPNGNKKLEKSALAEIKYYYNGLVKSKVTLTTNGNRNVINYFENGQIKEKYYKRDSSDYRTFPLNRIGEYVSYYQENGQIKEEKHYRNGKTHGRYTIYYYTGKIKEEGTYIDSKRHGIIKQYYEDGVIKSQKYYQNGMEQEQKTEYYKNGEIALEIITDDDMKFITEYYKNGEIALEKITEGNAIIDSNFVTRGDKRELVSISKRPGALYKKYNKYYESGQIEVELEYIEIDRKHVLNHYNENGQIKQKDYFYNFYGNANTTYEGKNFIKSIIYDKNGDVESEHKNDYEY